MANTLNVGNGNWATKENSLLGYNSENGNYKPLPFDFTRASNGTFVNKSGLIETVGSGEPRIDFLGNTSGALLLEPQRSNLVQYSEAFDNAYWTKSNTLILTNEIISPNGTLTSEKLYEDTANSTKLIFKTGLSTLGTISVFAKKADDNNRLFQIRRDGGSNSWSWFDLEDGTIQSEENGIASIDKLDNGWYRCSFTPTNSNGTIVFGISNGSLGRSVSYQGDGTSGVYIWGAQLEQGSYATSYIPTQGSIGTRVAESCSQTPPSGIINSSEGVLFANVKFDVDYAFISISDGTTNNYIMFGIPNGSTYLRAIGQSDGGTIDYVFTSTSIGFDFNKIAVSFKDSEYKFYINGVKVNEQLSGSAPLNMANLQFAQGNNSNILYGNVKDLKLYNTALTDQELINLTKI
jgi:hypothetical protein